MHESSPDHITADSPAGASERHAAIAQSIEQAAHLLPAQGPITVFIHHNTLHAFEHLPFEQAVEKGAHRFGCHPYLSEDRYRAEMAKGRIRQDDIEAVLLDDLGDRASDFLGILGTRFRLRQVMLEHPLRVGPSAEMRWIIEETEALRRIREEVSEAARNQLIAETRHWYMRDVRNGGVSSKTGVDSSPGRRNYGPVHTVLERFDSSTIEQWSDETWESFHLHVLWRVCRDAATRAPQLAVSHALPVRSRDVLLELNGSDSDDLVNGTLIRFCAAFLDQGFANWSLPGREQGFLKSFCALYERGSVDRWMRGVQPDLALVRSRNLDPLESIDESLTLLGVDEDDRDEYLSQTLLALRGWAGMIWQIESRGDRVARPIAAGSLVQYVAVRLLLERAALDHLAREAFAYDAPLDRLREFLLHRLPPAKPVGADRRAFPIFQLAQLLSWSPSVLCRLSDGAWARIFAEVESFSGVERRRIFHLAYERWYRIRALDAVAAHTRASTEDALLRREGDVGPSSRPQFQIVTCIDEREESFRRHLEEVAPDCETYSTAGFFAVAMYYRGAADAHYVPLCPIVVAPQHYVRERPVEGLKRDDRSRRRRRRAIGTVTHRVHLGSRTFTGGWLAALFGSLASIPLVMRILFPRPTAHLARLFGGFVQSPTITQLRLERSLDPPG
ncbi:MAG: putative inorganic carbon transporter subunit DabA, partial [Planctomycetaceae bacterium]